MPLIFLKLLNNKSLSIETFVEDTILNLKAKVEEKSGIPINEQILCYCGNILDDKCIVSECNITIDSYIYVKQRNRSICLIAKTTDGTKVAIEILQLRKINDLKKAIEEKIGLPVEEQILMFNNRLLVDESMTLKECQINDKSVISVAMQPIKLNVFVTTVDLRTAPIETKKNDTIHYLKEKVESVLALGIGDYELLLDTDILSDDATIKECNIQNNAVIIVRRYKLDISVRTVDGKIHTCNILRTDTVADIKRKIEIKTGIVADDQILVYNRVIVEDGVVIDMDYIDHETVINVIPHQRDIQITVMAMDGRSTAIDLKVTDKISDLKSKIEQQLGIASSKQTLVSLGRTLSDDQSLDVYCIGDKATVYMID